MKAGEQLAAMEMMAVDPLAYVAAPRFVAGVIAMPLLACVFNALGIFGAHLVGVSWLGLDNGTFWSNMTSSVDVWKDVINGVWKSVAFGAVVSLIAVFQGYTTAPTSEGVAYATTAGLSTTMAARVCPCGRGLSRLIGAGLRRRGWRSASRRHRSA